MSDCGASCAHVRTGRESIPERKDCAAIITPGNGLVPSGGRGQMVSHNDMLIDCRPTHQRIACRLHPERARINPPAARGS